MMYILYNTFSYLQAGNIENVVVQDIKFTFRAIVLEKYEKKHRMYFAFCITPSKVSMFFGFSLSTGFSLSFYTIEISYYRKK